jgi:hypothetical protein
MQATKREEILRQTLLNDSGIFGGVPAESPRNISALMDIESSVLRHHGNMKLVAEEMDLLDQRDLVSWAVNEIYDNPPEPF